MQPECEIHNYVIVGPGDPWVARQLASWSYRDVLRYFRKSEVDAPGQFHPFERDWTISALAEAAGTR